MQQQTNTTSNLQIKLITDARKLLEKVRSQQLLSADSSLDSSFLFDPIQDSKDNGGGGIIKKDSSDEDKKQTSPPLKFSLDDLGGSSTSSSFKIERKAVSPDISKKKSIVQHQDDAFLQSIPQSKDVDMNNNGHENISDSPQDSRGESSVEKLQEENMKLKNENYQLNEEMNDFEYKLYCLEQTLGIIEDVEKSQHDFLDMYDMPKPTTVVDEKIPIQNTYDPFATDGKLSPITAMVADAVISGSGVKENIASAGRDGPPSPTPMFRTQTQEIKLLRENNEKMVTAIKALAQATIAQTRKHYLYKKRHHMTKQMVVEESEKLNQVMIEKEKVQSDFYESRAKFLRERDMREELSNEIQVIAKKNNVLRREKQAQEDMRMKILDRVEFRDDAASVLSRISDSSCFPILQTITESGATPKLGRSQRSGRDKNVEKLIFKLISQLKKRDAKIEKLEKKLKITMQYLQGALELEVARQDAEVASQKGKSMPEKSR